MLPMIILQSFVAWFFFERHYQVVTYRLSRALTQDVAALIDLHGSLREPDANAILRRIARARMDMEVEFHAAESLPAPLAPLARTGSRRCGQPPRGPTPWCC